MNDKPEAVALKPCPFCGGEAMQSENKAGGLHWWQVECVERSCSSVGPTAHGTEAEAIAAWNTRATPPQDASALVEVLKAIRELCPEVTGDMSSASLAGLLFNIETRCDAALTAWEAQHG